MSMTFDQTQIMLVAIIVYVDHLSYLKSIIQNFSSLNLLYCYAKGLPMGVTLLELCGHPIESIGLGAIWF